MMGKSLLFSRSSPLTYTRSVNMRIYAVKRILFKKIRMRKEVFILSALLLAARTLYGYEAAVSAEMSYGYAYENSPALAPRLNRPLSSDSLGGNAGLQIYFPEISDNIGVFLKFSYIPYEFVLSNEPIATAAVADMDKVTITNTDILAGPAFRMMFPPDVFLYICPGFAYQHFDLNAGIVLSPPDFYLEFDRYGIGADIGLGFKFTGLSEKPSFALTIGAIPSVYFASDERSDSEKGLFCANVKAYMGFVFIF